MIVLYYQCLVMTMKSTREIGRCPANFLPKITLLVIFQMGPQIKQSPWHANNQLYNFLMFFLETWLFAMCLALIM